MNGSSNRLFQVLFVISVGIHTLVFLHIAGIYRPRPLSFIELTLRDMSKPVERNIPRPRPRPMPKERPDPLKASIPRMEAHQVSPGKPTKVESVESVLADGLGERIEAAPASQAPGAIMSGSDLGRGDSSSLEDYGTADAYLEMVRLRIEKHKQYPSQASAARWEGQVIVRFTIADDGGLRSVDVRKSSNKKVLDEAALQAVRSAAPFPAPPLRLFEGDTLLELTIVFELT
jgi:protein TonB